MGNMFLFALIVGIASTIVLIPFFSPTKTGDKKGDKKLLPGAIIAVLVILIPSVFAYYYFTNFDRNLSSLWVHAIVITALGALVSTGMERKVKALLFAAS